METVAPIAEVVEEVEQAGGGAFRFCFQCGLCDVVCPWNRVRPFSIRKLVRQAAFGLAEIDQEEMWRCTTCGLCPSRCPRGVQQIEVGVALRRVATRYETFAGAARAVRSAAASLTAEGNPLGNARAARNAWAAGLGLAPFAEGMELLWFVGCYGSYDPRMQRVAAATARLLKRAGVDFGILGSGESCCGESIRKAGNEAVFRKLARDNIKTFIDRGVKRILVSSPHCYHAFARDYRELRVDFEVVHVAQYLRELVAARRLSLSGSFARKVTWHDPCYLGRHHGIYDAPRELLRGIPGLELVEMSECRQDSLCCGGGGGRIWMDTPKGERFSDLRVAQARACGARVLATVCPYCISNFVESAQALPGGEPLEVKDLTEVLDEALGAGER